MTALLESPVGTLDVSLLEERQPDVPLICTRWDDGCEARAEWEGLCMGCGHVFRRCLHHYVVNARIAEYNGGHSHNCLRCGTPFYLAQYVRIGA